MSGYCKKCGWQFCICDEIASDKKQTTIQDVLTTLDKFIEIMDYAVKFNHVNDVAVRHQYKNLKTIREKLNEK